MFVLEGITQDVAQWGIAQMCLCETKGALRGVSQDWGGSTNLPEYVLRNISKVLELSIRGAQPSSRLSEEICLSEGSPGVSPRVVRGSLRGFYGALRGSAGFRGIFRGLSGVVTLCL